MSLKIFITSLLGLAFTVAASAAAPVSDSKYTSAVNHFAWGAELGGSIDLTSNDLSTINIGAYFGYRNSFIDLIGIGATIDMMVTDSHRAFPVYAIFRSNFRNRPSLCFFDMKAGYVFNHIGDNSRSDLYISPGLGINLARGRSFQSYVTLSYVYNGLKHYTFENAEYHLSDGLHMAAIRLGITF